MATYRVTFCYNAAGFGFSETWFTKDVSESNLGTRIKKYNELRMAMLPSDFDLAGIRTSQLQVGAFITSGFRKSRLFVPGTQFFPGPTDVFDLQPFGTYAGEAGGKNMEQLRSNLQIRLTFGSGRTTTRYVVGIPDGYSIRTEGTLDFAAIPVWGKAFIDWRDELVAQWNIAARSTITDDPLYTVRAITKRTTAPQIIGMVIKPAGPLAWDVGDKISVSGFRRTKTSVRISVNGNYHLDELLPDTPSTGLTTAYLRELIGVDPSDIKIFGTIRRFQRTIYSLASINTVRLGIHKRGKPSLTPRGRRLARISLDP